jgi:hypothetical protein
LETSFKLHGIEQLSFSLAPQPSAAIGERQVNYEFNIQQEQKTNVEQKLVIVFTTVKVMKPGNAAPLAALTTACGFDISLFDTTVVKAPNEEYLIVNETGSAISRLATGVTRGILYSQLRGSYLQDFILPLLPGE